MTHHITNWIGDDGFLVSSNTKIRRHNPEGDTIFIDGTITDKFEKDGDGFVEVTHEARNQDGELSILGIAVARLPKNNLVN